jgi:hypothetical protein
MDNEHMLLELDHISKIYGDLHAVDDLSLTVPQGQWLAIVGSSGSGKTTLMNMIGCMDTPSKGSVMLEGRRLEDLNARQLADVRSSESPVQINRRDLFREVEITANIQDRPLGAIQQEINSLQARFALPPGYRFMSGGDAKSMGESAGYALAALVLGIAFIYMILASQFGSFLQPLAIMMSLPLSLVGGAVFVLGCDLICRSADNVRLGIVTAVIRAPFFLWLLRKQA